MNRLEKALVAIMFLLIIGMLTVGVAAVVPTLHPSISGWLLFGEACLLAVAMVIAIIGVARLPS